MCIIIYIRRLIYLKIFVDKANRCRGKESLYFTTPKSDKIDILLDAIHPKYYDVAKKAFETNLSNFDTLLDTFIKYDVQIVGELPSKLEKAIGRLESFDKVVKPIYKTTPFKHQAECLKYAKTHPKFLLGDTMGLRSRKNKTSYRHRRYA